MRQNGPFDTPLSTPTLSEVSISEENNSIGPFSRLRSPASFLTPISFGPYLRGPVHWCLQRALESESPDLLLKFYHSDLNLFGPTLTWPGFCSSLVAALPVSALPERAWSCFKTCHHLSFPSPGPLWLPILEIPYPAWLIELNGSTS